MQMVQSNEFVLARDANGRHYEEFCYRNDANGLMDIMHRAEAGTLGGHTPQQGERYAARCYFYPNRVLVKLTKRKIKTRRIR